MNDHEEPATAGNSFQRALRTLGLLLVIVVDDSV